MNERSTEMTLLKQIVAEANGVYEPLSDSQLSTINSTNKLNGGVIVKSNGMLQVKQVPVGSQGKGKSKHLGLKESEALKAVLDSQGGDDDVVQSAGPGGTTADKLETGAAVKIKGTSFDGQEGVIDSFGRDKKFVIVKLADGKHSFHSADVISSEDGEDEDSESSSTDAPPATDVKKFYVAFYDSTRETSWIGKVSRENGGMWHEKVQQGKPDLTWGKEHEKYMTPDDIVGLYHRKMPHSLKIEGPFYELEDAEEFIEDNWGDIRESEEMKLAKLTEGVDSFHRNALKSLNAVLKRINKMQEDDHPPFSPEGERNLRKVYRSLYGALIDGGPAEFTKAWDKAGANNVDAFDEFADMLFQELGVKDYPEFAKKLGLDVKKIKQVAEALDAHGYHTSLKNPRFKQNDILVAHGDPREYLHDESSSKRNSKSLELVTFSKKARAEEFAKQLGATVVRTPSDSYRLVSKKSAPKKKEEIKEESHEGEKTYTDFNEWKKAVRASYPEIAHQIKFVGRVENAGKGTKLQTISAEVKGVDRSYGVWYPQKDEGSVLFESIFGPMGGDQRNMRGSVGSKDREDTSFKGYIEVDYPDWNKEAILKRAEKSNVKLSKAKAEGKTLRVTGDKSDVAGFLQKSGWNKVDLERWYPALFESIDIIVLEGVLTEAEIKVQALKVATNLLGTVDVKKVNIDDEDLDKAREFNKKQLHAADGQRWFISLFQLGSGKRFARIIPPKDSGTNPFFVVPAKGQ
jgi:hypothetical protein